MSPPSIPPVKVAWAPGGRAQRSVPQAPRLAWAITMFPSSTDNSRDSSIQSRTCASSTPKRSTKSATGKKRVGTSLMKVANAFALFIMKKGGFPLPVMGFPRTRWVSVRTMPRSPCLLRAYTLTNLEILSPKTLPNVIKMTFSRLLKAQLPALPTFSFQVVSSQVACLASSSHMSRS